jgi:hypothetical protein
MRLSLAILVCCAVATATRGEEIILPDGSPLSGNGGLIIMRRGNETTVSLGGVFLPRKVKVTTITPEGPVVTRFTMPSIVHSLHNPPFPPPAPAYLQVGIPDPYGLLYIEDELVRTGDGSRLLQSPPLPRGCAHPLRLRAVFASGDRLLIEDKVVLLRAGESSRVTFDGSGAVAVPLPRQNPASRR